MYSDDEEGDNQEGTEDGGIDEEDNEGGSEEGKHEEMGESEIEDDPDNEEVRFFFILKIQDNN